MFSTLGKKRHTFIFVYLDELSPDSDTQSTKPQYR